MAVKICFIVGENNPNHCGVRDYALRLAAALDENGMTATVLSAPNWSTRAFVSFCRGLRKLDFDIVHVQYPSIGFRWSLWPHFAGCLARRSKSVVTLHDHSLLPYAQRLSTHLFRWTTAQVLFTTDFEAARYRATLGKWGADQQVVPIGSNISPYPVDLERNRDVLYFGQIRPGRGLEDFIELARQSFALSKPFRFVVVGGVSERRSEYYRTIREQTPSFVQWSIDLPSDDVAEVLASSFAAYLPFPDGASFRRGSMLAAMANGLPVITRAGAATVPELRCSLMFATGAEEALGHLDRLCDAPECFREMLVRARSLTRQFSWEAIARRHAEIYLTLLSA
jgi:glycosyltransferase involved in cell wall biosynthesis